MLLLVLISINFFHLLAPETNIIQTSSYPKEGINLLKKEEEFFQIFVTIKDINERHSKEKRKTEEKFLQRI